MYMRQYYAVIIYEFSQCINNMNIRRKLLFPETYGLSISFFHTFSAFWLRSSVVSVLLSLISETWSISPNRLIRKISEATWLLKLWLTRRDRLYAQLADRLHCTLNVTLVLQYLQELRAYNQYISNK